MIKDLTHTMEFTEFELKAAHEACSNYTPKTKVWKQAAQFRASNKIARMLMDIERERKGHQRKVA